MLAEMTRAFNGGFGLGAHGIAAAPAPRNNNQVAGESAVPPDANNTFNNQESSDSRTPSLATLPPEGSFERFLMDLQIDLRTALTQSEDLPHTPAHQGRLSTPSEPVQRPQEAEARTEVANDSSTLHPLLETQHIGDQYEGHRPQGPPEGTHAINVDSGRSSMPDLSEVYETDSEFEDAEEDSDDDGMSHFHLFYHFLSCPRSQLNHLFNFLDFHSARHASNPVINNSPRTPTLGAGRIDALGRINWWRLYRFPPVMPPRLDMANFRPALVPGSAATTTTPSGPPTLPIASSTVTSEGLDPIPTIPSLPSTSANSPSSSSDTATLPSPPHPQTQDSQTPQTVVPVIVVGLQSVNSDWRPDMPPPDDTEMDVFGHNHGLGGAEIGGSGGHEIFDDDFDGFGNLQHPPELLPDEAAGTGAGRGRGIGAGREGRPRGWQSRAANAIRNLRPGRRPAPPGTQHSVTTPGSRTFLIYVIGGLYFWPIFIIYLFDIELSLINDLFLCR